MLPLPPCSTVDPSLPLHLVHRINHRPARVIRLAGWLSARCEEVKAGRSAHGSQMAGDGLRVSVQAQQWRSMVTGGEAALIRAMLCCRSSGRTSASTTCQRCRGTSAGRGQLLVVAWRTQLGLLCSAARPAPRTLHAAPFEVHLRALQLGGLAEVQATLGRCTSSAECLQCRDSAGQQLADADTGSCAEPRTMPSSICALHRCLCSPGKPYEMIVAQPFAEHASPVPGIWNRDRHGQQNFDAATGGYAKLTHHALQHVRLAPLQTLSRKAE